MPKCNLCGKNVKDVAEHIRKIHQREGLSEELIEYLKRNGKWRDEYEVK